jgi:DNA-binding PadR family transcriptional regulator
MAPQSRPTPLGLTVLSLLVLGPLHPYGMKRLIKQWGKDQVVNVGNPANLYKTIARLSDSGLIEVHQTERDSQYPERTLYALTDTGRETGRRWLEDMLSTPRQEFAEFPAALSFLMLLGPEAAITVLKNRRSAVNQTLERLTSELAALSDAFPRVTSLETEYQIAILSAETAWLTEVITSMENGELSWGEELYVMAQASIDE